MFMSTLHIQVLEQAALKRAYIMDMDMQHGKWHAA
jgi:hypothetical protein